MQDFWTRLLVFVLLPVSVGLLLQALYFSNVPMLEHIIVPDMGDMHGSSMAPLPGAGAITWSPRVDP